MYSRTAIRTFLARPSAYTRPAANGSTAAAAVFQAEPKPPVQGVMQVREDKIVGRDVVGYGLNGEPQYFDSLTYPFPSVRFLKNTPDILVRYSYAARRPNHILEFRRRRPVKMIAYRGVTHEYYSDGFDDTRRPFLRLDHLILSSETHSKWFFVRWSISF